MFARYLFVRLSTSDNAPSWAPIRSTLGVSQLVRFGTRPAKVEDPLVDLLRNRELAQPTEPLFNQGDTVVITEGPFAGLEAAYKEQLTIRHGVVFNRLLALANMPIRRFGSTLLSRNEFHDYMRLLKRAHRKANLEGVMCRTLISVGWRGEVHDCDFNQMLGLPLGDARAPVHLSELLDSDFENRPIHVADHCYGCTAGQGSSCGGALATGPGAIGQAML